MFKWVCYVTSVVFGVAIVFLLASLSLRANQALQQSNEALTTVNEELPEIVGETKQIAHTLGMLAEDVNGLKELAGVQPRDRSLVAYANAILDLVERETAGSAAFIGVPKTLGSGLKDVEPVAEFLVGARREATVLVFRAKSPQEVLHRLSHNWSGKPLMLREEPAGAVTLEEWIRGRHSASAKLPVFEP
ncbi:MAG: DUF948 domain-containing protein [bacterium]|nr:DUF948 domain-containing protein [bacterium]